MKYSTIVPNSSLQNVVECFWIVEGSDTEQQKIIPDGFPEIIFHFGDPYLILDRNGEGVRQERQLISGQISRPIVLRATGKSDVFGIKFQPSGIWKLFGVNMNELKDEVTPIDAAKIPIGLLYQSLASSTPEKRIRLAEEFLLSFNNASTRKDDASPIVKTIDDATGNISIDELHEKHHVTARTLQRIFRQQVGITAKQYARIVRFRTVYALLQKPALTKSDSLFLTGYFDQPHFNREFREFTHENPEKWFAENNAFSNLFMNR